MGMLANYEKTLFIGQSVRYDGHALFKTLQREDGELIVPMERRIEMPVVEDFQMGFCTGLALQGFIPVCIFPRFDFLLLATNQIVNHLDKIPLQSGFRPKVIIRVAVGATKPLDSGLQHTQDHSQAFRRMLRSIKVFDIHKAEDVVPIYQFAMETEGSVMLVEHQNLYNEH